MDDTVNRTDTLNFDASFAFTGNTGQKSAQNYSFANSRGQTYNCTLQAENRALTSASEGCTEQIKRKP